MKLHNEVYIKEDFFLPRFWHYYKAVVVEGANTTNKWYPTIIEFGSSVEEHWGWLIFPPDIRLVTHIYLSHSSHRSRDKKPLIIWRTGCLPDRDSCTGFRAQFASWDRPGFIRLSCTDTFIITNASLSWWWSLFFRFYSLLFMKYFWPHDSAPPHCQGQGRGHERAAAADSVMTWPGCNGAS